MTNRIKTVRYPKLILVRCENAERVSELISDILNFCSYNTSIDDFSENTDYIICCDADLTEVPEGIIADTVLMDQACSDEIDIDAFRTVVADYDELPEGYEERKKGCFTFSAENYYADLACRNICSNGSALVFDIVSGGILSRVRVDSDVYSVDDIVLCTSVLVALGIPMAAVLGYFNR